MSFKLVSLFCAQFLLIQNIGIIAAQWTAAPCAGAWSTPCVDRGDASVAFLAASNGPAVTVSTTSPRIPAGVSVLSENSFAGELAVGGALPFLGTVALEGILPTAGFGAVAYSCGNGVVEVTAEDFGALGFNAALGYGAGLWPSERTAPIGTPWATGPLAATTYDNVCVTPTAAELATASSLSASNGPGLAVSTSSAQVPAGVSILSENEYEGALAVGGALPLLGTVALEGALPAVGAGAVAYGCGNGAVGITAEDISAVGFAGIAGPLGYGPAFAGPLGYGPLARPGCGCGALY